VCWNLVNLAAGGVNVALAVSRVHEPCSYWVGYMPSLLLRLALTVLCLISFGFLTTAMCQTPRLTEKQIHELKLKAVQLINGDRRRANLPPVQFDELSSTVGDKHCHEVLDRGVISHWSSDGRTPYMRYSWAGGRDGVAENLSDAYGHNGAGDDDSLFRELVLLEDGLMSEKPPNDGHRQNILTKHHTHVGIGLAWTQDGFCYAQEFIDRYVRLDQIPITASLHDRLMIRGNIINSAYRLHSISITYEPFPHNMSKQELESTYAYSLPDDSLTLRPKAPADLVYADGSDGEITQDGNSFQSPIKFYKGVPGIYTIVVVLTGSNDPIQATMISIRVEK